MKAQLITVALLCAAFIAGWKVANWQHDSQELVAERAARDVSRAALARESDIAATVEEKLAGLKASERIIDRGIIREVQKPIYQRVCLEPDAIRLLNHAASATTGAPAKPDAAVPKNTAITD